MDEEGEKSTRFQMSGTDSPSFCLSFNSYSCDRFAEIAAKVGEEFNVFTELSTNLESNEVENDEDFEFEAAGDDIFSDGQFPPIFPIFDRSLLVRDDRDCEPRSEDRPAKLIPLRDLFIEDRDDRDVPSCSSSEADELEGLPPRTYCIWKPKLATEASPSRCKKSNSTGSASKRWSFRDLLRRCNSDGKDPLVFLAQKNRDQKREGNDHKFENKKEIGLIAQSPGKSPARGRSGAGEKASPPSAHEAFYVQNRAMKEGEKKKSFLPYRKDLVGLFANTNGLRRTSFPPFSPF